MLEEIRELLARITKDQKVIVCPSEDVATRVREVVNAAWLPYTVIVSDYLPDDNHIYIMPKEIDGTT